MTAPCLYCQQPLTFAPGRGWLHPDGAMVVVRGDGRDDHVATPDRRVA